MAERGIDWWITPQSIALVLKYAPELDKRVRPHLSLTNDSWRVDETYIEVKGEWKYLYPCGGLNGQYTGFYAECEAGCVLAAARFFRKVLKAKHIQMPRVITVDKNAAYPVAIETLKADGTLEAETELRQNKYLNNVIEQDHRNVKRITKPMMEFKSFNTARRTLRGIEAMNMIRIGQVYGINQGNHVSQAKFIEEIFGVIA